MLKLRNDTKLINFPGYCKKCKVTSIITEPRAN
ncbi:MAG: cysteine-rich KTR domain-containing protein [Muribaculaceae bacterium]|nr:cysteine-rich KTR domain-containing protein [Muribaculaceae bacterium]MCM1460641.1 cysteine-rich KTR domain-containing protein [Bacteroides sp.]